MREHIETSSYITKLLPLLYIFTIPIYFCSQKILHFNQLHFIRLFTLSINVNLVDKTKRRALIWYHFVILSVENSQPHQLTITFIWHQANELIIYGCFVCHFIHLLSLSLSRACVSRSIINNNLHAIIKLWLTRAQLISNKVCLCVWVSAEETVI